MELILERLVSMTVMITVSCIIIYFVSKLIRDCNSFISQSSMSDQEIVPLAELQIQV